MKEKDFAVGVASGLAVGMTLGLVIGTMAGVLFAPARGAETRRRLRYERDYAVDAARFRVRRTMARLHLAQPEMERKEEKEEKEEEGAFSGA
jgi:gas vesicle protein